MDAKDMHRILDLVSKPNPVLDSIKSLPDPTKAMGPAVELGAALGPRNPAKMAVEKLIAEIAAFEEGLTDAEEVGGIIIGAPGGITFHITNFYNLNMDILVFEGINEHRRPQRLVQHVSQLSILLTALPKLDEKPRRLGFHVPETP